VSGLPCLTPKILGPRRRSLGVAHGVLDRAVSKAILDGARVVAGVGKGVAAAMPQHVAVHREIKAGALADALDQPIGGIGRERTAALGRKDVAPVRELR
jgi:hypothetical protein